MEPEELFYTCHQAVNKTHGTFKTKEIKKMKEVKINEMVLKFYDKKGCPILEIHKGNAIEYCTGMDYGVYMIEVEDPFEIVYYINDPRRFEELEESIFTEEDEKAITRACREYEDEEYEERKKYWESLKK